MTGLLVCGVTVPGDGALPAVSLEDQWRAVQETVEGMRRPTKG